MSTVPAFASASQALDVACAALRFAASADAAAMPDAVKAECLHRYERAAAVLTAGRAWTLASYTAGHGYSADAEYSAGGWLRHRTKVTKAAARAHVAWARRADAHPGVLAALAEGTVVSESVGRAICCWTDRLPEGCRDAADAILVAAARAGADEWDLAGLAAEIYARSLPAGDGPEDRFTDRSLRLETTYDGAGVIAGDLTPECAALVGAVLDALSAPLGAQDTRTHGQRYHDGLQEAMRRLAASDLLPQRAGQPVKALVHVTLAELRALDGDSALEEEWVTAARARWAAARAAASTGGGDGGAWLDGDAARGLTCDAMLVPVVTGDVDPGALEDLVQLCVTLAGHHGPGPAGTRRPTARPARPRRRPGRARVLRSRAAADRARPGDARTADHRQGRRPGLRPRRPGQLPAPAAARRPAGRAEPAAGHRLLRHHPGRDPHRGHPAGPALPVDRRLHPARHRLRSAPRPAQGRRRPDQPQGLHPALRVPPPGCIHRWGWTLVLHPDGTTTAWNRNKTKVLRSHSPPPGPG